MGLNSNSDRKLMILKYLPNLGVVGGSGRGGMHLLHLGPVIVSIINCTTIHRYPIFSSRYSIMCKVYTGYHMVQVR